MGDFGRGSARVRQSRLSMGERFAQNRIRPPLHSPCIPLNLVRSVAVAMLRLFQNSKRKNTMLDHIKPRGFVSIRHYDERGTLIASHDGENLIVNGGKNALAALLRGAGAGKEITGVEFGDNATPAALTDTAITNPFYKILDGQAAPSTGVARFTFSLAFNENNGATIAELGLKCSDGTLFSRYILPTSITKASSYRLEFTWEIQF